jgi:hypothetical protein
MWYNYDNLIIFNDFIENTYCTKIFNIDTRTYEIINYPFYTISSNRKYFLTIDFERLALYRRGYSYINIENKSKLTNYPKDDGIFKYDFFDNSFKKLLSFSDINLKNKKYYQENAIHYIEHLMISPNDNLVAFLYRIKLIDNELITKLCIYDLSTKNIKIVNSSNRLTHFSWKNNNEIIAWAGTNNKINQFRFFMTKFSRLKIVSLKIYKFFFKGNSVHGNNKLTSYLTGDSYKIFNIQNLKYSEVNIPELNRDGHPSFSPISEDIFITDTYPDKFNKQNLFLVDLSLTKVIETITLDSNIQIRDTSFRCDLHPKWSICGNYITIDETINNNRGISIFKLIKHEL